MGLPGKADDCQATENCEIFAIIALLFELSDFYFSKFNKESLRILYWGGQ